MDVCCWQQHLHGSRVSPHALALPTGAKLEVMRGVDCCCCCCGSLSAACRTQAGTRAVRWRSCWGDRPTACGDQVHASPRRDWHTFFRCCFMLCMCTCRCAGVTTDVTHVLAQLHRHMHLRAQSSEHYIVLLYRYMGCSNSPALMLAQCKFTEAAAGLPGAHSQHDNQLALTSHQALFAFSATGRIATWRVPGQHANGALRALQLHPAFRLSAQTR
jgi:hypothetical protein